MRRWVGFLGLVLSLYVTWTSPAAADEITPNARAAVLLDAHSGQILYNLNGDALNYPASTTKLLTALVAVEHGQLDQVFTISDSAVNKPPGSSSCYLESGEQQSLENLLYGLLISSGNDCADAIAEGITDGEPERFIAWMNETAKRLGATHSHFTNPHGLHDPEHYTTAIDLARIARGALANPTVRKIAGTREFFWPGKSERNGIYYNHNQLLWTYEGTIGGKTGFTEQAGLTLVSAAQRGNRLLIGVVMGERLKVEQYREMVALLDFGFGQFEQRTVVQLGEFMGSVPVHGGTEESVNAVAGESFYISVARDQEPAVTVHPLLTQQAQAPIQPEQKLGIVEIRENGSVLGTIPLVAARGVDRAAFLSDQMLAQVTTALKYMVYLLGGLFLFRTVVRTVRRAIRHRQRDSVAVRRLGGTRTGSISTYRSKWR